MPFVVRLPTWELQSISVHDVSEIPGRVAMSEHVGGMVESDSTDSGGEWRGRVYPSF